jgi:UDP-glucose 4-epimerase
MKYKNVVITGGSGFIGSNLARNLAANNKVIVIDDLSTGNLKNIKDLIDSKKIGFIKRSITNLNILQKTFKNIDYVFHEAAIPSVPRSIKDPLRSNFVNVNGTLNVLIAARDNNIQKVIYASSSSVYGDTPTLPKKEKMKPRPLSPYAISKLTAEYYCQVFSKIYSLPTVSLRYFNVYGRRQSPSSEYAAVIPKFITNILHEKSPLIYGDGKQTRDFTYVDDVVKANILAAESDETGIFNIAGGNRISINDLAYKIMDLCKKNLKIEYTEPRHGDIKHSYADISKAKEKLNYAPGYILSDGLKEVITWYRKQT